MQTSWLTKCEVRGVFIFTCQKCIVVVSASRQNVKLLFYNFQSRFNKINKKLLLFVKRFYCLVDNETLQSIFHLTHSLCRGLLFATAVSNINDNLMDYRKTFKCRDSSIFNSLFIKNCDSKYFTRRFFHQKCVFTFYCHLYNFIRIKINKMSKPRGDIDMT